MKDLIARLEAATEGSRELDAEIDQVLDDWPENVPHYTTSLDAALTLVPEGAEFDMTTMYGVARVTVGLNFNPGPFYASNDCGLLPCAVSAAALKARESQP